MKCHITFVGLVERPHDIFVHLDAIPREGDSIEFPHLPGCGLVVRTLVWSPLGEGANVQPSVYIVVGRPRP